MKQNQTNQIIPRLFYRPSVASTLEFEIAHFHTLSWANRCNGNGSFECVIPLDLADVIPQSGGVFYLKYLFKSDSPDIPDTDYYDTLMFAERIVRRRSATGKITLEITGSPRAIPEADLEDAQNNNAFYIWRFDRETQTFSKLRFDINSTGQTTTFHSDDIYESSISEDNLGGHEGAVVSYKWGTTVIGQSRPFGLLLQTYPVTLRAYLPTPAAGYRYQYQTFEAGVPVFTDCVMIGNFLQRESTYDSYIGVSPGNNPPPTIVEGEAYGNEGYMNTITYQENWVKSDVVEDVQLSTGYLPIAERNPTTGDIRNSPMVKATATVSKRTIVLKTQAEYLQEMQAMLPDPASGTIYEDPDAVFVKGGHKDYTFSLKSWGNQRTGWSEPSPYPLFLNIGGRVEIEDTVLQTDVLDILSGVVETIDDNGYNIELELGTIFPRINTGF